MKYTIEEFNPNDYPADDPYWDSYYEFIKISSKERDPDEPVTSKEMVIKRQHQGYLKFAVRRFLAIKDDRIIAWFGLGIYEKDHPEYEINGHTMQGNITVLSEFERHGVGTAMFKEILRVGKEEGIKILAGGVNNEKAANFIRKMGGKVTVEGSESRLLMDEVDWNLMQSWVDEGPKHAKDVDIQFYEKIPDEIFTEYLEIFNEGLNLQPLGESSLRTNIDEEQYRDFQRRNEELENKSYTYITIEANGKISGMTEISISKEREYRVNQGLTTVRPEYRGRGLGKWLKGQMMLFVREKFPDIDFISTDNATTNEPMLSINHRMGFREHKGGAEIEFDIVEACELLGI